MTREEAIVILKSERKKGLETLDLYDNENDRKEAEEYLESLEMAIQALENIGHLTDRPCSVCEFRKENGCCKWDCVFKGV